MLITVDNYNDFCYENENARIMIKHTLVLFPYMSISLFDEDNEISEEIALCLWRAANNESVIDVAS